MSDAYEDISDVVADLKLRVEALERELAAMKTPVVPNTLYHRETGPMYVTDLHAKWDNGKYDEGDFA